MDKMKRVLIIANKTWEAEPLINALLNPEFKPKELTQPKLCLISRNT